MEEKIKNYVNYQFRFDNRDGIENLKEEIIANLIDRYHENIKVGKNPEEAYVEAIKSMGDFSENKINDIPEEFSVKPSIPDILLMSGAILSVFGLIITLFSAICGAIITAISIILFSGSAYYLYSYSQYVRKQYMDIEKHNMLLKKIFKYMKTSFVFWAISLSWIMASLVMSFITRLILIDPTFINFENLGVYLLVYAILFVVSLIIFLLIFRNIYNRIMNNYYFLTGTTNLKGKIREGYEFLYGDSSIKLKRPIILSKNFMPILGIIMILLQFFMPITLYKFVDGYCIEHSSHIFFGSLIYLLYTPYWVIAVAPILALFINIILITRAFKDKSLNQWKLLIGYYVWFISILLMYSLIFIPKMDIDYEVGYYSLFMIIILLIIILLKNIVARNINKQKKHLTLSKNFMPILGIIMILPQLLFPIYIDLLYNDNKINNLFIFSLIEMLNTQCEVISIVLILFILINILLIALAFMNKIRQWLLVIGYYGLFLSVNIMYFLFPYKYNLPCDCDSATAYAFVMCIILTIIIIYRNIVEVKSNKKLERK